MLGEERMNNKTKKEIISIFIIIGIVMIIIGIYFVYIGNDEMPDAKSVSGDYFIQEAYKAARARKIEECNFKIGLGTVLIIGGVLTDLFSFIIWQGGFIKDDISKNNNSSSKQSLIQCNSCGKVQNMGNPFCIGCGITFNYRGPNMMPQSNIMQHSNMMQQSYTTQQYSQGICLKCGSSVAAGTRFCAMCGTEIKY